MRRRPPTKRKLPPGTRHHEPWCAIFWGKTCDCDDDHGPEPYYKIRGGGGGQLPKKAKELENA